MARRSCKSSAVSISNEATTTAQHRCTERPANLRDCPNLAYILPRRLNISADTALATALSRTPRSIQNHSASAKEITTSDSWILPPVTTAAELTDGGRSRCSTVDYTSLSASAGAAVFARRLRRPVSWYRLPETTRTLTTAQQLVNENLSLSPTFIPALPPREVSQSDGEILSPFFFASALRGQQPVAHCCYFTLLS